MIKHFHQSLFWWKEGIINRRLAVIAFIVPCNGNGVLLDIKALILVITSHLLIVSAGHDSYYTYTAVNDCEISYLFKP